MRELTDTDIRYGPANCPGCIECTHCQQQRKDVADLVKHLRAKIARLERKCDFEHHQREKFGL